MGTLSICLCVLYLLLFSHLSVTNEDNHWADVVKLKDIFSLSAVRSWGGKRWDSIAWVDSHGVTGHRSTDYLRDRGGGKCICCVDLAYISLLLSTQYTRSVSIKEITNIKHTRLDAFLIRVERRE